jgi:hypothetical protein
MTVATWSARDDTLFSATKCDNNFQTQTTRNIPPFVCKEEERNRVPTSQPLRVLAFLQWISVARAIFKIKFLLWERQFDKFTNGIIRVAIIRHFAGHDPQLSSNEANEAAAWVVMAWANIATFRRRRTNRPIVRDPSRQRETNGGWTRSAFFQCLEGRQVFILHNK